MKTIEYYSGKNLVYPKLETITCKCGKTSIKSIRLRDDIKFCSHCGDEIGDKVESEINIYKEKKAEYYKIKNQREQEFKKDLFIEYGVVDNLKADRCFEIAWDNGHSDGHESVIVWFDELVDLIK